MRRKYNKGKCSAVQDYSLTTNVVKILYTFDMNNEITCLARTNSNIDIPIYDDPNLGILGMVQLSECLNQVCTSSPEIIHHLQSGSSDYSVYSIDFTELDNPFVGHGELTRLLMARNNQDSPKVIGKVCKSMMPFYNKDTLEIQLRLKPIELKNDINNDTYSQHQHKQHTETYRKRSAGDKTSALTMSMSSPVKRVKRAYRVASEIRTSPASFDDRDEEEAEDDDDVQSSSTKFSIPNLLPRRNMVMQKAHSFNALSPSISNASNSYRYLASSPPTIMNLGDDYLELPDGPNSNNGFNENTPISPMERVPSNTNKEAIKNIYDEKPSPATGPTYSTHKDESTSPLKEKDLNIIEVDPKEQNKRGKSNRGSKHPKRKEVIQKCLEKALMDGATPDQCYNCRTMSTSTWRRLDKITGEKVPKGDKNVLLCNPCGLYLTKYKIMRPENLWDASRLQRLHSQGGNQNNSQEKLQIPPTAKKSSKSLSVSKKTSRTKSSTSSPGGQTQVEEANTAASTVADSTNSTESNDWNKENLPPRPSDIGVNSNEDIHTDDEKCTSDIDALFSTPKRDRTSEATLVNNGTPASKWLSRIMSSEDNIDDTIKSILNTSPLKGRQILSPELSANLSKFTKSPGTNENSELYDAYLHDLNVDHNNNVTVNSNSPSSSFYYLYDDHKKC